MDINLNCVYAFESIFSFPLSSFSMLQLGNLREPSPFPPNVNFRFTRVAMSRVRGQVVAGLDALPGHCRRIKVWTVEHEVDRVKPSTWVGGLEGWP